MSNTNKKSSKFSFAIPPAARVPLFMFIGVVALVLTVVAIMMSFSDAPRQASVNVSSVSNKNNKTEAEINPSEHYKQAVHKTNKSKYNRSAQEAEGVAMPLVFANEIKEKDQRGEIEPCVSCTPSDAQLIAALKRLGYTNSGATGESNVVQVGQSDIFLSGDGDIVDLYGNPLLLNAQEIKLDSEARITDEQGNPVLVGEKHVFISEQGELIHDDGSDVLLAGALTTDVFVVYLSNGKFAYRENNMSKLGASDVFVTKDGQLVTLDGRPIRHSGEYVYRNLSQALINKRNQQIGWENRNVFQSDDGVLLDVAQKRFATSGVLFSYDGILIDNNGRLTKPLAAITRIGQSDLYLNQGNFLTDSHGNNILSEGVKVKFDPSNRALLNTYGQLIKNRGLSDIRISEEGILVTQRSREQVFTGVLTTEGEVGITSKGLKVNSSNTLERLGQSDIFRTSDGYISDIYGAPFKFSNENIYLDMASISRTGGFGLETYQRRPVLDSKNNRVYMSPLGLLTDINGRSINETGVITSAKGVMITPQGKLAISDNELELVTTKSGESISYNGLSVYRDNNNQLFDSDGNPILSEDGLPLYMDDLGIIKDESGNVIESLPFTVGQRALNNGEISTRQQLLTSDGQNIFYRGKETFLNDQNQLVDQQGNLILTEDGLAITIDENGNLVDSDGNTVKDAGLRTASGMNVNSGIIRSKKQVVSKDGRIATYNGKKVFIKNDGSLIDANGNQILSSSGSKLYLDDKGNIVDAAGNPVSDVLSVSGQSKLTQGQATTRNKMLSANGNAIKYNGKEVFVDSNTGQLFDADGKAVKSKTGKNVYLKNGKIIDHHGIEIGDVDLKESVVEQADTKNVSEGTLLTDAEGRAVFMNGKKVYISRDGSLVDETGQSIKTADGRKAFINADGQLVDANNMLIKDPLLKNVDGETVNSKLRKGRKVLLDAKGKVIKHKGRTVYVRPDGSLEYENGEIVTDSNGNSVKSINGELVSKRNLQEMKEITDIDGAAVTFNGKKVYSNASGQLFDENGVAIKSKDGRDVFINANGETVDATGRLIADKLLKNKSGAFVARGLKKNRTILTNDAGQIQKHNGKTVYVDENGYLQYEDGTNVLDDEGNKLHKNDPEFAHKTFAVGGSDWTVESEEQAHLSVADTSNTSTRKLLTSPDGMPVTYNGKQVFLDDEGRAFDEFGNKIYDSNGNDVFVNRDGVVVDQNNKRIDESLFFDANNQAIKDTLSSKRVLTDEGGHAIQYNGRDVFVNDQGYLEYADGTMVTDEQGNAIRQDNGQLINSKGQIVKGSNWKVKHHETDVEQALNPTGTQTARLITDRNGNEVYYDGKRVYRDSRGRLIDETGELIKDKNGKQLFVNSEGNVVDANNNIVDDVLKDKFGSKVSKGLKADRKVLLDNEGAIVKHNGKTVFVRDDGILEYSDGSAIKDRTGQLIRHTGSRLVGADDGRAADTTGFSVTKSGTVISKAANLDSTNKAKLLTTNNGDALKYKGMNVYKGADGKLYDERGNAVKTSDGRDVYLDNNGNLVDKNNSRIREGLLEDSRGNKYSKGIKAKRDILTDASGRMIKHKGKTVFIGHDGALEYSDGNKIKDAQGAKVFFKDGKIVNDNGSTVKDSNFQVEQVSLNQVGTLEELIGENGMPITYQGKQLFKRSDGAIIDSDGNVMKSKDGNDLYYNKGKITDSLGNEVLNHDIKSIASDKLQNANIRAARLLKDKNNKALTWNGKQVYVDSRGRVFDQYGNRVTTKDGDAIHLDNDGNLIDSNGNKVSDILMNSDGDYVSENIEKGANLLIDANGKGIKHNGKFVYKNKQGELVYSTGERLTDAKGSPLIVTNGKITDSHGRAIDASAFSTESENKPRSLITRAKLTTKNGDDVTFGGEKVYKAANGLLLTETGKPVLDALGNRVYMDANGMLVNKNGQASASVDLMSTSGKVMPGDLKTTKVGEDQVMQIGASDIFVSKDGTLLDAEGGAILYNGKRVKVQEDGSLTDEYGKPIRDKQGKKVFISNSGKLVHSDGSPVLEEVLTTSKGVLLSADGKEAVGTLQQIGDSDLYRTASGKVVDKFGKEVLFNGESVFVGNDGSLITASGRAVRDKSNNKVYLNPKTGRLVNNKGELADSLYLESTDGTLINSEGHLINSGGYIQRVGNSDIYRTNDGMLVTADGKAIKKNGEIIYVDEKGKIVNRFNRPIKYRGRELYVDEDGVIIDSSGGPVTLANGEPVFINEQGDVVTDEFIAKQRTPNESDFSQPVYAGIEDAMQSSPRPDDKSMSSPAVNNSTTDIPDIPSSLDSYSNVIERPIPRTEPVQRQSKDTEVSRPRQWTEQQLLQILDQRMQNVIQAVDTEFAMATSSTLPNSTFYSVSISDGKSSVSNNVNGHDSATASGKGAAMNANSDNTVAMSAKPIILNQHTNLYVATKYTVNSDFDQRVVATIIGGVPTDHMLYNAEVHGTFELKYEHLVLSYSQVCPINKECMPIDALAISPETNQAGIATDVDTHFWYRYGGLFLSTFSAGIAEAMAEASDKTEVVTPTGTKTTRSGLDGPKLAARSLGVVGETFIPLFAERFNRPPTVIIDESTEMQLKLFSNILGK